MNPRSEPFGLFSDPIHEFRAHDSVRKSREVLHVGSDHQLTTGLTSLEHQRIEVGPTCVQSSCESGRAGPDDNYLLRHGYVSSGS